MKKDGSNDRLYKTVKALNKICKDVKKYELENWIDWTKKLNANSPYK